MQQTECLSQPALNTSGPRHRISSMSPITSPQSTCAPTKLRAAQQLHYHHSSLQRPSISLSPDLVDARHHITRLDFTSQYYYHNTSIWHRYNHNNIHSSVGQYQRSIRTVLHDYTLQAVAVVSEIGGDGARRARRQAAGAEEFLLGQTEGHGA